MQPENRLFVASDEVEFILPTHITFVASSSFDGANFAGAVGSTFSPSVWYTSNDFQKKERNMICL